MGVFDNIKDTVSGLVEEHKDKIGGVVDSQGDKIDQGIEQAGDFVDEKTGGKFSEQIDAGQEQAKGAVDGLGSQGDTNA